MTNLYYPYNGLISLRTGGNELAQIGLTDLTHPLVGAGGFGIVPMTIGFAIFSLLPVWWRTRMPQPSRLSE